MELLIDGIGYDLSFSSDKLFNFTFHTVSGSGSIFFPSRKPDVLNYIRFNTLAAQSRKPTIEAELVELITAQPPYFASIRYALMPAFNDKELLSGQFTTGYSEEHEIVDIDFEIEVDGPWITLHLYQPLPTEDEYKFRLFPTTEWIINGWTSGLFISNEMLREAQ